MFLIGILLFVITETWSLNAYALEPLTLQAALGAAYQSNPSLSAAKAQAEAEHSAVQSQSFLDNPQIGFMHENNMNFMEMMQGPMDLLSISQAVKFPAKYFLLSRAQNARASQVDEMASQKKFEVRTKVITAYFNLFSADRVLSLLNAQRESLREIARIAEARYATGSVPQQDEMKAHVEQTLLEKDILLTQEERSTVQATLEAALGNLLADELVLPKEELSAPKVKVDLKEVVQTVEHKSRAIQQAKFAVEESNLQKSLAYLSYAPDFSLSYRRAIGSYASQNSYSFGIEMVIPLWFFAKQSSEVSSASARQIEAEKKLEATRVDHVGEMKSLIAKVQSLGKVLDVYQTGLIPQASSTLNSSRAAYRAGKTGFIELLDSERSLYNLRIAYYRTLAQYAESVAKLEEILGESISTLPSGGM